MKVFKLLIVYYTMKKLIIIISCLINISLKAQINWLEWNEVTFKEANKQFDGYYYSLHFD